MIKSACSEEPDDSMLIFISGGFSEVATKHRHVEEQRNNQRNYVTLEKENPETRFWSSLRAKIKYT